MSTDVVVTTPGAELREILVLLAERGVSGLPVVDPDGVVVGVVSQADILARSAIPPGEAVIGRLLLEGRETDPKVTARNAAEAMSSPAIVIEEDRPVAEAAARMLDHGVKRLPVVQSGKLVGIVTRSDLLRAFTRPDEEITREIREDVLARLLGLSPIDVAVHVENGVAAVRGQVATRSEAAAIEALLLRVPGVVSVRASISWRADDRASLRS